MQGCNIVILFANFQIALEKYMKLSDRLICAFQRLYIGGGFIQHCLVCILTHRKHSEMQYCIFIHKLLDTIGRKYEHVGYVDVGISVAVCWCGIDIVLSNMYIDSPGTCRDAILLFYLQITR